jgi:alkanesulfonate monooxygenase SsuD/methylene tetrahydromethanopterin reductase-like flavin-dependent oxidoreductase (luciferase family)
LGVGLGWNAVEYTALNENFHNRGRRIEEQITVLRELWTKPLVSFTGKWHTIPDAGLNPLPIQRPIPIWMGGYVENVQRRIARLADGWMCGERPPSVMKPAIEQVEQYRREAGRARSQFGLEARIPYGDGQPETWRKLIEEWTALGVTHLSFNAMGKGFTTPDQHLNAIREFAKVM